MNQRIGYARVSTDDQVLDSQRDALQWSGVQSIYEEMAGGKADLDTGETVACVYEAFPDHFGFLLSLAGTQAFLTVLRSTATETRWR